MGTYIPKRKKPSEKAVCGVIPTLTFWGTHNCGDRRKVSGSQGVEHDGQTDTPKLAGRSAALQSSQGTSHHALTSCACVRITSATALLGCVLQLHSP